MFEWNIRHIWYTALGNFRTWRRNPRVVSVFAMAFVFSFLLSQKAVGYGAEYGTLMQAFEPFIWTFGDGTSVMAASSLLIFLFADLPRMDGGTPFFLIRTTKKNWIAGQILYMAMSVLLYVGFVLLATTLICMKGTYPGNLWSETAARLGYSSAGNTLGIPVHVRVMERVDPWQCTVEICLLMVLYCCCMVMWMLLLDLKWGKRISIGGGILFGLFGLLLNPEVIQELTGMQVWRINVISGWLSPLNHATYKMHNFGYDYLPTIGQTYLFFTVLLLVGTVVCLKLMNQFNFIFNGRENHG